jgi:BirA family biotin operon repressor/biotin-[acetyl-CoA-carboxylase] ligase
MRRISKRLFRLVECLNQSGIHSGESLAEALGVSRNAVWKHIQQLIKYGVEVESIPGKGYRLNTPISLLSEEGLFHFKEGEGLPIQSVDIFGSIGSTNDEVRLLPPPKENHLICCLAEHQTQGRGRFDRKWVSPFGQNIMLSIRALLNKDMSSLGGITLVMSLAVKKALETFGLFSVRCKWPNDIYVGEKKLAGMLVEVYGESHGLTEIVIGIGLNVNMIVQKENRPSAKFAFNEDLSTALTPLFSAQVGFPRGSNDPIEKPWTSMQALLSSPQDRTQVARALIEVVSLYLNRFLEQGLEGFVSEWSASDALFNQVVTLKVGAQEITGIARGVNSLGHLKIEGQDGKIMSFSSGEASVGRRFLTL